MKNSKVFKNEVDNKYIRFHFPTDARHLNFRDLHALFNSVNDVPVAITHIATNKITNNENRAK